MVAIAPVPPRAGRAWPSTPPPALLDVEPPGRRAAKLVPQVRGDDPDLDRAAAEARAHRRLEQAGERERFPPHVAEAVVGHATERLGIELLPEAPRPEGRPRGPGPR